MKKLAHFVSTSPPSATYNYLLLLLLNYALSDFVFLTNKRLEMIQFGEYEVYNILKNLKVAKASGPDHISNRLLKECAVSLVCR